MPFDGSSHTNIHLALPFIREDYFELVDTTGRAFREDKRGHIPESPPIVSLLGIKPDKWIERIPNFGLTYSNCVGFVTRMADFAEKFN